MFAHEEGPRSGLAQRRARHVKALERTEPRRYDQDSDRGGKVWGRGLESVMSTVSSRVQVDGQQSFGSRQFGRCSLGDKIECRRWSGRFPDVNIKPSPDDAATTSRRWPELPFMPG